MTVYPLIATLSRGEFTPKLHGRPDIQDYAQAAAVVRNMTVMRHGGLRRRPGSIWINNLRNSNRIGRVKRFEFNEEQAYALLFNDGKIRFATLGGEVRLTAQDISGITQADPAVVTYSGSDTYANGDRVFLSSIAGMVELNNREFMVGNVDTGANTFELVDGFTSLLMHFDGSDASTTMTDTGPYATAFTANGDAQLDTAQFKFGTASLLLDGTGDYVVSDAAQSYFNMQRSSLWTVEFFVRPNSVSGVQSLLHFNSAVDSANHGCKIKLDGAAISTENGVAANLTGGTLSTATWYHVAVVRNGTALSLYLEGNLIQTGTAQDFGDADSTLYIGDWSATNEPFDGWIDAIRLSQGVARYSGSTYTVPASAYDYGGIDSSAYTAYSSGGSIEEIYEIDHAYADADLFDMQFEGSADTIYIAHGDYRPAKLVRSAETSWTLSDIDFEDGPWLDEDTQGTYFTPASTGAVHPIMTSNTTPSGTASNDEADLDAWEVFDTNPATTSDTIGMPSWWQYDFAGSSTKICDGYWIQANDAAGITLDGDTPASWKFQGYTGSAWITLDTRNGETGWDVSEVRYYSFVNETGYQQYRLYVTANDGDTNDDVNIAEMGWHESGDSQTAFNLTASAVTGINDDAGFQDADVGRTIRLMGTDGRWRWARIVSVTSTTVVTIRLYQHSLPNLDPITRWQLSAFSESGGYPKAVGFFEDRLGWGGTSGEPLKVWLSKSGEYENHGISDPVADSDGINARMTGGKLNRVQTLKELEPLVAGTAGTLRVIDATDPGLPFSLSNIKQKANGAVGVAAIQPVTVGVSMIFADRYKQRLYEFGFDLNSNSFVPRELSIESDHLFQDSIIEMDFQQEPDNFLWSVIGNGRLVCLTIEQAQRVAGFTDIRVSGGGSDEADVESIASIPSTGGDVAYMVVERTIDGETVRSLEYFAPYYETGDTLAEAVYFDFAGSYSGAAVGSVSGLWYIRGESVGVLADGIDVGDVTVSATGTLTLPTGTDDATNIVWGKRYSHRIETLRAPQSGNSDGTALGRRMNVLSASIDMLNTAGIKAGSQVSQHDVPRAEDRRGAAAGSLNTGIFDVPVRDKHDNDGVVVITGDKGYPATIRAIEFALEGEP